MGNVLVTISDKKIVIPTAGGISIDHYEAEVVTANDYYPFGMTMPGRNFKAVGEGYRYGFNGKENDKDISEGDLDFGARIYDGRLGRFLSVDRKTNYIPYLSPYSYANNTPIMAIDRDGDLWITIISKEYDLVRNITTVTEKTIQITTIEEMITGMVRTPITLTMYTVVREETNKIPALTSGTYIIAKEVKACI